MPHLPGSVVTLLYHPLIIQVFVHRKQVLSLKLYKSEQPSAATATKPADKEESKTAEKTTQESGATTSTAAAIATVKVDEGGHDPLEGLDDITKTCFEV